MNDQNLNHIIPNLRYEQLLQDCHKKILESIPIAPALFAETALPVIQSYLRKKFPHTSPELIASASADAILTHLKFPARYDSSKSKLTNYLNMIAFRDLANQLDKENRRRAKEIPFTVISSKFVELYDGDSELQTTDPILITPIETMTPEILLLENEKEEELAKIFPDFIHLEVAKMVIDGIRETSHFANVMGISHLEQSAQRTLVKQCKDMVKKRLERAKWI